MVTYRSRYSKFLHKQHKQALKRKEREERFREKQKKKKTKEIEQKISLGDKLVSENQLKNAFHLYSNAKDIASNYNKSLVFCCEEKKKFIRNIVNQNANNKLESTMQEIDRLFLAEQFTEIEPITRNYFNYLKKFKWVQIDGKFDEFHSIMLNHWEIIFPRLVTLADGYYDKKQHKQAIVIFAICKEVVKKFKFGPNRTHLIEAFMRYEMICDVQISIAKMYSLVERERGLMDLNKRQEARATLNAANSLESEIPPQFRDKKRLNDLRSKMNQLWEDSYK